ncbi:hypothetical protein X756_13945 [Mesorhizobium sp. LSHC412B00]|nr:hypothetical protein X756_13945 [Mesorhizobium sp. LSHC412B00]
MRLRLRALFAYLAEVPLLGKFLPRQGLLDSIFVAIANAEPRRIKTG